MKTPGNLAVTGVFLTENLWYYKKKIVRSSYIEDYRRIKEMQGNEKTRNIKCAAFVPNRSIGT